MSEKVTIEHYINHVMGEITKRDVEQVSERLRALGWEEIVRCRDCKYYEDTGNCTFFYLADGCLGEVTPDGFCAWGERRDA